MKTASKMIAAAVLTLGVGATAIPASADFGDFGQHVYTERSQSRAAPDGFAIDRSALPRISRSSQSSVSTARGNRQHLFDQIDAAHKAY